MSDWKIRSRGASCFACEKEFADGEAHYSTLLFEEENLVRRDHCLACFEKKETSADELIFWRTHHQEARQRTLVVDFDAVEALFLALENKDGERLAELRYLLGLLLMRKRRLKLVKVKRTGEAEFLVVRRPRRQDEILVRVFDLDAERAAELRGELERIFEGEGLEEVGELLEEGKG